MYAAAPMLIPGKRIGEQSERFGSQIAVAVLNAAGHGWDLPVSPDRRQFRAADPLLELSGVPPRHLRRYAHEALCRRRYAIWGNDFGATIEDGPMTEGLRIYNLFPTLAGSIADWTATLPRIAAMGFNAVYVNPFHYPGFSGSLYAVKDYYRLNPRFRPHPPASGEGKGGAARRRRATTTCCAVLQRRRRGTGCASSWTSSSTTRRRTAS